MKLFMDCLPCNLRQILEASRMVTEDTTIQEEIMARSIQILSDYKKFTCSPDMSRALHKVVKDMSGVEDPYKEIKERDINTAKALYPFLESFYENKQRSLYWAVKISATGNIIDSAVNNDIQLEKNIEKELEREFAICDIQILEQKLKEAKSLLIIGDNAGETVFDKILLKHLSHLDITYAVRSKPVLNDTTEREAYDSGLGEYATILPSGSDMPGTVLEECNSNFIEVFEKSDIVISKGQGNFETLSGFKRDIFYLLKAKCPIISNCFEVQLNDYVFKYEKNLYKALNYCNNRYYDFLLIGWRNTL